MSNLLFDDFPQELIEAIVSQLDLKSAGNLRLASQKVAAKVSAGVFRSFFLSKHLDLHNSKHIDDFGPLTRPTRLGSIIRCLTVISGNSTPFSQDEEKRIQEQINNAMQNLSHAQTGDSQLSLALTNDKLEFPPKEWKLIWAEAAAAFRITVQALGLSKVQIEEFHVFNQTKWCSLPCDDFSKILEAADLSASFKHLKTLSLNLSHHMERVDDDFSQHGAAAGQKRVDAICDLLRICPELEDLRLQWYRLHSWNWNEAAEIEERFFGRITEVCQFPRLKTCELGGVLTSEDILLSFLRQVDLTRFVIEDMVLEAGGSFRPAFDYLTEHMHNLEYLHFENLFEEYLIQFETTGEPYLKILKGDMGPNFITRTGPAAREPIIYGPLMNRIGASPEVAIWLRDRSDRFGPMSQVNYRREVYET